MDTSYRYKIVTITHKTTHLNDIGQFVIPNLNNDEALQTKLTQIKQALGLEELMYLATCNRIMFLFVGTENVDSPFFKTTFFNTIYPHLTTSLRLKGMESAQYFEGLDAINHLFKVAASMDSLVIGEREILRQLREAYDKNHELGLTGDAIRLAMRFTVEAAKGVYTDTKIGEKPISVVSLAFQKLLQLKIPTSARILLVGAGQTNRLVVKFLLKYGYLNVVVFNRSLQAAKQLANLVDGDAHLLESLNDYSRGFDVIFAATNATEAIVTTEVYKKLLGTDSDRKVLIDLSIPNNIESSIATDFDAAYIPIESLRELAQQNMAFREQELIKANMLVEVYVQAFEKAFKERQIELALREVPTQIKAIRQHALDNVFRNEVAGLDDTTRELLERMMAYMEKRCIAIPIQVAKEKLAHNGHGQA